MSLIVQKFGGSSVRDAAHLRHAAEWIAETYRTGNDVIVVLSAQGSTTDVLLEKAREINPEASGRELDMLLATGEQASVALCAMALERLEVPCVSLAAWQAGIRTTEVHGDARIREILPDRIRAELDRRRVVLVTGFQGVDDYGDLTTLGRGGSDTSAVALAGAFHAERCQIYTDVDGVYTADPRLVPEARKLVSISWEEMLALADAGAQVLHARSVELAKQFRVELEVLSSLERKSGTRVCADGEKLSGVVGLAGECGLVLLTLSGLKDGTAADRLLRRSGVPPRGRYSSENGDAALLIRRTEEREICRLLTEHQNELGFARMEEVRPLGAVTAVGHELLRSAAEEFKSLEESGRLYLGEARCTALLPEAEVPQTIRFLHKKLFGEV